MDGRCANSAPFRILNKNYAHASIYFYQERGRARALRAQLFSFENLPKIVAGSQRVTSCERTLRGSKGIQPSLVSSIHFFKLAMFLKTFIVANCQSLIREVFTTSRVYVKPDVGRLSEHACIMFLFSSAKDSDVVKVSRHKRRHVTENM